MHGPHQQSEIQRGVTQEAETNIIILTCCPGCKVNAKSSPHPLSRAANMESDASNIGRVKGERRRKREKDEMKRSERYAKKTYL